MAKVKTIGEWVQPFRAKKLHLFVGGISLCRKWNWDGTVTYGDKGKETPTPQKCIDCLGMSDKDFVELYPHCPACHGDGADLEDSSKNCDACLGTGLMSVYLKERDKWTKKQTP